MHLRYAVAALLTLSLAGSASAAVLDAPSLQLDYSSRTSAALDVTAGNSGAPSGFTVEWMAASVHDQLGGWPAASDSRIQRMDFVGTPTLNIENGTSSYLLNPSEATGVEIGDLFDETGVVGNALTELTPGIEYVIRVRANGGSGDDASVFSETQRFSTLGFPTQNCTYTQGYWKTHGAGACHNGNNADEWPVGSLTLGTVNYTAAQLCAIFNQPAQGNGLTSLAHQLIAAKLNIAQGAVAPPAVAQAIADADALIGGLIAPPIGSGSLAPNATSGLTGTLDQFNNGVTGPGHCGATPAAPSTWGNIKTRYR